MHDHHHHDIEGMADRRLGWAIAINVLLTAGQIAGGIVSGSLALVADALHNLGDAAALAIAWLARRIARRPPDHLKTFGYRRAEVVATLINLTTLAVLGLYLAHESVWRLWEPRVIDGGMVVAVAAVALVVDAATALLTHAMSRQSMNLRAAFLHNLSDALASAAVIASGVMIMRHGWFWSDSVLTLLIAGYVLYQAFSLLPGCVHILMQGAPEGVDIDEVARAMAEIGGVDGVHHLHLWRLDERESALEAHVEVHGAEGGEQIKREIKALLAERFAIRHVTLELEWSPCDGVCRAHGHGG